MSYALRLATDLRNAYEWRDRAALELALERMVANMVYTGPIPGDTTASTTPAYQQPTLEGIQRAADAIHSMCERPRPAEPIQPYTVLDDEPGTPD